MVSIVSNIVTTAVVTTIKMGTWCQPPQKEQGQNSKLSRSTLFKGSGLVTLNVESVLLWLKPRLKYQGFLLFEKAKIL